MRFNVLNMEQDAFKRKNSVFLLKVGVQTPTFINFFFVGTVRLYVVSVEADGISFYTYINKNQ